MDSAEAVVQAAVASVSIPTSKVTTSSGEDKLVDSLTRTSRRTVPSFLRPQFGNLEDKLIQTQ